MQRTLFGIFFHDEHRSRCARIPDDGTEPPVQPTPLARAGAGREFGRLVSRDGRSDLSRLPAGRLTGNVRFWRGLASGTDSESQMFQIRRSGSDGAEESAAPPSDLNASARAYRVGANRRTRKVPAIKKITGDHESYRRPRKLPATKKTTGDHESYRRPRKLPAIKKPTGDQETYRRCTSATEDLNTY
jgi:hypothetical protein